MVKYILLLFALSALTLAEEDVSTDEGLLSGFLSNLVKKNPELRQLWHVIPGPREGQIIAFIQITVKAKKSCGTSCKFTVYYAPMDKSEKEKSIETTWANKVVNITGLVPGKMYAVWACMHSYTDFKGRTHDEECSWRSHKIKAQGGSPNSSQSNIIGRKANLDETSTGEVHLLIRDEGAEKTLISYLLKKILDE